MCLPFFNSDGRPAQSCSFGDRLSAEVYFLIISSSNLHSSFPWLLTYDILVRIITFCPDVRPYRAVIHDPKIQAPGFHCMNPLCSGLKVKFNATRCQNQARKILETLRDTNYRVTVEGNSCTDVKKLLEQKGIRGVDLRKLPGAKLQKWNLYTQDKLKEMTAKGESYENIKTVRLQCLLFLHVVLCLSLMPGLTGSQGHHWPQLHHLPDHHQSCLIPALPISVPTRAHQTCQNTVNQVDWSLMTSDRQQLVTKVFLFSIV